MRVLSIVIATTCLLGCGRVAFEHGQPGTDAAPDDGSEPSPDAMASDLVLYVPFTGTTHDVARGRVSQCSQCPQLVTSRAGLGMAARFAATECVEIPDDPELRPPVFTYALWVRPRILQASTVFGKAAMADSEDSNSYELWIQDTGLMLFTTNDGTQQQFTFVTGYLAGQWYHVAASFDGTTKRLYLDGVERSSDGAVPSNYDQEAVRIGCDREYGAIAHLFDGDVDDLRLYNRVLTASEISALAQ